MREGERSFGQRNRINEEIRVTSRVNLWAVLKTLPLTTKRMTTTAQILPLFARVFHKHRRVKREKLMDQR